MQIFMFYLQHKFLNIFGLSLHIRDTNNEMLRTRLTLANQEIFVKSSFQSDRNIQAKLERLQTDDSSKIKKAG